GVVLLLGAAQASVLGATPAPTPAEAAEVIVGLYRDDQLLEAFQVPGMTSLRKAAAAAEGEALAAEAVPAVPLARLAPPVSVETYARNLAFEEATRPLG